MAFYFVRHAHVEYPAGLCYGATDVPANAAHTAECAARLAHALPSNLTVISSPLVRCVQLAEALCGLRPDLAFVCDARIAEMDFGSWEGLAWDGIPRAAFDAWTADFGHYRVGGKTSVNEFLMRIAAAWDDCAERTALSMGGVVWISHAGVARAVRWLAMGRRTAGQASDWPQEAIGYGELWMPTASTTT
jgi:alpha-ribazole phosphatase